MIYRRLHVTIEDYETLIQLVVYALVIIPTVVIGSAIVKNEEKKKEQACILKNVNGGFDV